MIIIETDRLLIRDHKIEDLNDYHKWISDPKVMNYVNGFPISSSIQESGISLDEAIESQKQKPRIKFFMAIILKGSTTYIGSTGGMIINNANVEKNMSIRSCHNPECRWEEMLTDELRFCPICDWEIKGWKSKTL